MHKTYQAILDKRYADIAKTTRRTISVFLGTLPPPRRLTPHVIRRRLNGLAPATRSTYMSYVRALEQELGLNLLDGMKRPKVPRSGIGKGDLYTARQLKRLWRACNDTKDRALFMVLYEGALRADEVLGLNFSDIRPDKRLWWLTVKGKGGKTRPVPVLHSIEALQQWLDVHPTGKGAVFVTQRRPFRRMAYSTLRARVKLVLDRAGISGKRRLLHTFRHTRLTELARMGLTEAEMCTFAGWEIGSPQTEVYVHMSGRDLKRSFGRIYGLEVEEQEPALKIEAQQCPRCKRKNPPTARFCSQCSLVLDEELALRLQPEAAIEHDEAMDEIKREMAEIKALLALKELKDEE